MKTYQYATLLTCLFLLPTPMATAQNAFVYVSGYGDEYTQTVNENGSILTSVYPKTRLVGSGADIREVKGPEIIFLGKDCDAVSEFLGAGRWGWANAGFEVQLANYHIFFPRQELEGAPEQCHN